MHLLQYTWLFPVLQRTQFSFFYKVRTNDEQDYTECHLQVQVLIFFFFVLRAGLFDWRFDGLPVIRIWRPAVLSPSAVPILSCGRVSCNFFRLSDLDKMTSVEIQGVDRRYINAVKENFDIPTFCHDICAVLKN